ncbi:MAG: cyclophilin-like fold protein [Bulleidia sp.]|nr:cyclophilin-like fold protein [Bulleidia sp.]
MTLRQLLEQGHLTCSCENYGGFEKVVYLGEDLPSDDEQITTQPGDIMLYDNDKLVMFHASNTWSYTRIGTIAYDDLETLKSALSGSEDSRF